MKKQELSDGHGDMAEELRSRFLVTLNRLQQPRSMWLRRAAFLALLVGLYCFSAVSVTFAEMWVSHGPEGGLIYTLAIDPASPSTLYAGAIGRGVFKSDDGGESWREIDVDLTAPAVARIVHSTPQAVRRIGHRYKCGGLRQHPWGTTREEP